MQHTRILPPLFSACHLLPPPASRLYPCVSHTLTSPPISSAAPARLTVAYPFTMVTPPTYRQPPTYPLFCHSHTLTRSSTFTHQPPLTFIHCSSFNEAYPQVSKCLLRPFFFFFLCFLLLLWIHIHGRSQRYKHTERHTTSNIHIKRGQVSLRMSPIHYFLTI